MDADAIDAALALRQPSLVQEERDDRLPQSIPHRKEMEERIKAKVVTFDDSGVIKPGGMCGCCGSGPKPEPDWRPDPWYVYQAGICDADGVFYSMLCEGCLEEMRMDKENRIQTFRDEQAAIVNDLLGDDLDGAQAMMDDLASTPDPDAIAPEVDSQRAAIDTPRFELGQVVMTPGVERNTTHADRMQALRRHVAGDWGDVCDEDAHQNEWALKNDARILSSYLSSTREVFWIITEADRASTTILLPSEY